MKFCSLMSPGFSISVLTSGREFIGTLASDLNFKFNDASVGVLFIFGTGAASLYGLVSLPMKRHLCHCCLCCYHIHTIQWNNVHLLSWSTAWLDLSQTFEMSVTSSTKCTANIKAVGCCVGENMERHSPDILNHHGA